MKKLFRILLLTLLPLLAAATHQVSGYITFKHMHGLTYQVTLINYTNGNPITPGSCQIDADRDTMRIWYGDGTSDLLVRSNGGPDQAGYPGGQQLCECRKVNIYTNSPDNGITGGHTFPGAGSYHMWIDDQNRMANIMNIGNGGSSNIDFYLFTTINIGFAGDSISSPTTVYGSTLSASSINIDLPVCDTACVGECYNYNLGAFSTEGDSIAYSLGDCMQSAGTSPVNYGIKAASYFIPAGSSIDAGGTLHWCNPQIDGIYNFSIRLVSYKHTIISGSSYQFPVDTMDAEIEIIVTGNCDAIPPTIKGRDTCVVAGTLLTMEDTATDADIDPIKMSATGQPFSLSPPATFSSTPSAKTVTGKFVWQTTCADVRNVPYSVTVKATDPGPGGGFSLSSYLTTTIHVIGPAPTNLTAKVSGNSVELNWDPSICQQVTGYNIYRAIGCVKFVPSPCQTGVPAYTGYVLIGTTSGIDSVTYTDNNVIPGLNYSYLVVATYPQPDGSLSIASNDTCVLIRRNLPLLTNVSVDSTSLSTGTIFLRWIRPLAGSTYLDTNLYPPPYKYKLWRAMGMNNPNINIPVDSVTTPYFGSTGIDTTFKDKLLNTQQDSYRYKLSFYYNTNTPIGSSSAPASSIYLTTKPGNRIMKLSWASNVPWTDSTYSIYRRDPGATSFSLIATVPGTRHAYTDSILSNLKTYCYYVESKSYYADPTILHPLFDSSEVQCNAPKDTVPPCTPKLAVLAKCNTYVDSLVWNNPDHFCPAIYNDILEYKIYFSPTVNGDMGLIKTINNVNDTTFVNNGLISVAGCYAVTAVDSFGNESALNTICVDNCPEYQLPNVFTPNGDNQNDLFTPILPFKFIKSIDINIYNRWGQLMFHTIDPMINWDGKDQTTHGECPDGVYYYICTVNEIRVTGVKPVTLKGFIEIIR
ncbi:MAG TPA: gliding motility-associated C-terminal domain-containing protein [Bacteroidia bacterium]|nr:gliding motility-associated C-terminal domain-containing protein [Bacteroidia bacterium]